MAMSICMFLSKRTSKDQLKHHDHHDHHIMVQESKVLHLFHEQRTPAFEFKFRLHCAQLLLKEFTLYTKKLDTFNVTHTQLDWIIEGWQKGIVLQRIPVGREVGKALSESEKKSPHLSAFCYIILWLRLPDKYRNKCLR